MGKELTENYVNNNYITLSFLKPYERRFLAQSDRLRCINGAVVNEGMCGYLNEVFLPYQPFDTSLEESHSADGAIDKDAGFQYNANDSDVTIPAVQSKHSVDYCFSYLTGLRLSFNGQKLKSFSTQVWEVETSKIDAVNFRIDKPKITRDDIELFRFFCKWVLNIGG